MMLPELLPAAVGGLFEELPGSGEIALGAQRKRELGLGAEERRVVVREGAPPDVQDFVLELAGGGEILLVVLPPLLVVALGSTSERSTSK